MPGVVRVDLPVSIRAIRPAVDVLGAAIQESQIIKWYGSDADYALITESLCNPMLEALIPSIVTSPESSNERLRNLSIKLSPDSPVQNAINFLIQACLVYERKNMVKLVLRLHKKTAAALETALRK